MGWCLRPGGQASNGGWLWNLSNGIRAVRGFRGMQFQQKRQHKQIHGGQCTQRAGGSLQSPTNSEKSGQWNELNRQEVNIIVALQLVILWVSALSDRLWLQNWVLRGKMFEWTGAGMSWGGVRRRICSAKNMSLHGAYKPELSGIDGAYIPEISGLGGSLWMKALCV